MPHEKLNEAIQDAVMVLADMRTKKPDAALSQREAQSRFCFMVSILIQVGYSLGYEITFGESFDDDNMGHMKNSLHYIRLAQDLNLFKDGKFLTTTEAHAPLGEFWEKIGGSWGGRFSDGNHYSLPFGGRR